MSTCLYIAVRIVNLPEVRWALLALILFVLGAAAQLVDTPMPVWWAL